MAVARHLEYLREGRESWNRWREKYPKLRPGLTGAKLSSLDLSGMDLKKVNLSGADLRDSNLSSSDLRWADLSSANLKGADLSGTLLLFADLAGADLTGTIGLSRDQIVDAVMDESTRLPN